jgi:hypothetical protein
MTHPEDVVAESVNGAKGLLRGWLKSIQPEDLLRVDAIQTRVDTWPGWVEQAAFDAIFETLTELGERRARSCPRCGRNRERDGRAVRVRTKRLVVEVPMYRYRCRACGTSSLPVRDWLGVESGQTTSGFDRAVVTLASELSFGATATQMMEQHGHSVNRTLVERRAYAIGKDAMVFLEERGRKRIDDYMERPSDAQGVERVDLQLDSGGVRVGVLTRPCIEEATERTPARGLPKGKRTSSRREVRAIVAKCLETLRRRSSASTSPPTTTRTSQGKRCSSPRLKPDSAATPTCMARSTWPGGRPNSSRISLICKSDGPSVPTTSTRWSTWQPPGRRSQKVMKVL